jgi:hypothetical protein
MLADTIVVPFDSDNIDNVTLWSSATQIIYQLAVVLASIGSLLLYFIGRFTHILFSIKAPSLHI